MHYQDICASLLYLRSLSVIKENNSTVPTIAIMHSGPIALRIAVLWPQTLPAAGQPLPYSLIVHTWAQKCDISHLPTVRTITDRKYLLIL